MRDLRTSVSRWIEHRAGWPTRRLVKTARRYRTNQMMAGDHVITAAGPIPGNLRAALINNGGCGPR